MDVEKEEESEYLTEPRRKWMLRRREQAIYYVGLKQNDCEDCSKGAFFSRNYTKRPFVRTNSVSPYIALYYCRYQNHLCALVLACLVVP